MTKQFDTRTVLTVTTGRLLTKPGPDNPGMGDLYAILGWMTSDKPYTHTLGRFCDECKPWLLRWFPELAIAERRLPGLDVLLEGGPALEVIQAWVESLGLPVHYDVPKIPMDDHDRKDPVQELKEMRPDMEILVVDRSKA